MIIFKNQKNETDYIDDGENRIQIFMDRKHNFVCSFDEWMTELRLFLLKGYSDDFDAWHSYYENYYSPQEALKEDMSYGI